jgi:hypothetical protein
MIDRRNKMLTKRQIEDLQYSDEYAEYIMENAGGDRIICNGNTLIAAMEDGYLWNEFLESIGEEQ